MTDAQKIAATVAKQEITEVIYKFSRALDRLDEDLLADVFWGDAEVDLGPGLYQGPIGPFIPFAMQFQGAMRATQHSVSNTLIELDGDRAIAESHVYAFHVMEQDGEALDLIVGGRYIDEFERRNDAWRIAKRTELLDWAHERPATADWFDRQPPLNRGEHSRDDGLYKIIERFRAG